MTLAEFRALNPDEQRQVLADMDRRAREKIKESLDHFFLHEQLESELVPRIQFKKAPPTLEPLEIPLREGVSQEEHVRRIFRSDVGIKEVRCADGSIYQRK
jgi:hypothetical protein